MMNVSGDQFELVEQLDDLFSECEREPPFNVQRCLFWHQYGPGFMGMLYWDGSVPHGRVTSQLTKGVVRLHQVAIIAHRCLGGGDD